MSKYISLLKKELKSVAKEKTIIFAIIVQFFIASFSSVILTGIMAFYDPSAILENTSLSANVGYIGDMNSPLVGYLRQNRILVKSFARQTAAEEAFLAYKVDGIMLVPETRSGVVDIKLILPKLGIKKILMLVMLDEPLKKYENYLREANNIPVIYKASKGKPYSTYELLYSVIIPILMLFPALIAGSVVIDTLSEEFENKTFETLLSAPIQAHQIFMAKISSAVITAAVQVGMWAALLKMNGVAIHNLALLVVTAFIFASTISFGAAIIAMFFKDRERAQIVYSMTLIIVAAGTYVFNPSPFSLLIWLSAGVPDIGLLEVAFYAIPLLVIASGFFSFSDRIMMARR